MREILFRGRRTDNGKWVEGNLIVNPRDNEVYIGIYEKNETLLKLVWNVYKVSPETVSQYTGLTDKNGKKIFEGDVLKVEKMRYLAVVVFHETECSFVYKSVKTEMGYGMGIGIQKECEVIGNIHDNPELLEVGAK